MTTKTNWSILTGAAFLMATSAIGPGFLTQTALFTAELGASFGFVILVSVILDSVAQLTIWRVVVASGKPAQEVASRVLPGLGYVLAALVFAGGIAFNIGNLAGAGLGLNVLAGSSVEWGAAVSAILAIGIFVYREAAKAMDHFSRLLGLLMIVLTAYVAIDSRPPMGEVVVRSVIPENFSFTALLTIVGGTVGGYITFAGAHRLLDAGMSGTSQLADVNKGAVSAIGISSLMRILLFIAAFGVVSSGRSLDPANPPASVFQLASGEAGYRFFGLVMWSAAITSVVGSAYTSVSFIKSFHPSIARHERWITIGFILVSCLLFVLIGKPVKTLLVVGALNGLILPVALTVMIIAVWKRKVAPDFKQPAWLTIAGILVVGIMAWMGIGALGQLLQ
jgi:Mn2+/Fe2+ NRAMP family transporter